MVECTAIGNDIDPRRDSQPRRARRDGRLADEHPGEAVDPQRDRRGAAVRHDEDAGSGADRQGAVGHGSVVRG
ncbi:MAG: hypothetical protein LBK07_00445, partial [Tannerella sp.]|nr:hypothetical protein [Tannerella sp.]